MKIKKRTFKWTMLFILVLLVVYGVYSWSSRPVYDNPFTPKPVFGNPQASVKIVEFGDLQCPACRAAHFETQRIKDEFKGNISYQFFHFPLRSIHPFAQKAAEAAECANDQGKFFEFVHIVYQNQESIREKDLKSYASTLGLNTESFSACLDSGAKRGIVEADLREGASKNIQGTPTFFINGKRLDDWRYDEFKAEILAELR